MALHCSLFCYQSSEYSIKHNLPPALEAKHVCVNAIFYGIDTANLVAMSKIELLVPKRKRMNSSIYPTILGSSLFSFE